MRTRVVHCKEPYDVYIGRRTTQLPGSIWGNPYVIGRDGTRDEVIEKYRKYILDKPEILSQLETLRGKTLGCWCKPQACHGDVLVELLGEKRNALDKDIADLAQIFEPEGRIIICQRTGKGKGCTMMWAVGDKVTCSIPWRGDVHGIVRSTKMEGLSQKVQLRIAVYNPLGQTYIISNDKRWFDGENISPRVSVIKELGEHE